MKIKDTHWFCRTIDIDVIGDINDSVLWLTLLEILRLTLTGDTTKLFQLETIYDKGCHICLPAVNKVGLLATF